MNRENIIKEIHEISLTAIKDIHKVIQPNQVISIEFKVFGWNG